MKKTALVLLLSSMAIVIYFTILQESQDDILTEVTTKQTTSADEAYKTSSFKKTKNISRDIANQNETRSKESKKKNLLPKKPEVDFDNILYEENQSFKKLKNFYVVPKRDFKPGVYEVVERRAAFYIVKSDYPVGDSTLTVVTVKGSKYLGVVTGVLKVQLDDYSNRDEILDGHNYTVLNEFEHINRVFYKLEGFDEASAAYEDIKERVPYVELEILQYERTER